MKERKFKVVVLHDGKIVIEHVPVKAGQSVEVTVHFEEPVTPPYPLRELPVLLIDPFGPAVDESEWESSK